MTDGVDFSVIEGSEHLGAAGTIPVRSCVGCRQRSPSAELIRVVVGRVDEAQCLVPDLLHRAPGRGAHLHPRAECLDLAERRRAFPRALRVAGPLDVSLVRAAIVSKPG